MNIRKAKIVPDLRIFEIASISKEHGRRRCTELEEQGVINPKWTPTGRCLLSFEDAEQLAASL